MKQIRPSSVTFLHQDILSSVKLGQLLPIAVRLTSSKPPGVQSCYTLQLLCSAYFQRTLLSKCYEEQTMETLSRSGRSFDKRALIGIRSQNQQLLQALHSSLTAFSDL